MALLLLPNCQRPGAVTNMIISEFDSQEETVRNGQCFHVIRVHKHKTGKVEAASIVMARPVKEILDLYRLNIRSKIIPATPQQQQYLFLTTLGTTFTNLSSNNRLYGILRKVLCLIS